ncbi:MAG: glycerate kinase [Bacteroidetes bacterium]|nr:glycerate kinase [Bacteroidota bacterium]
MKIIIAPDKFKGSLTAFEVCKSIEVGIKSIIPKAEILSFPMADGGDGFASILQAYLHTVTIECKTVDPVGRSIDAAYQWNQKTKTAIIEMAVASGLVLLKENEKNPLLTSSLGTGLLIKDAINKGANKIILGIGGSATNDGGIGILEALGFSLKDKDGKTVKGVGGNLDKIASITPPVLKEIKFEIACDVQNSLYGPTGASYIYAPQKGANSEQVKILDNGLKNLAEVLKQQTGKDISTIPGTGAAGGIAAPLLCFFDTELKQGVDMVIGASGIEDAINGTDLIITGEGKIDKQSLDGKVIGKIASLANEKRIPVIAFCGRLELSLAEIKRTGLSGAYVIGESISVEESMKNAGKLLTAKAKEIAEAFIK